MGIACVTLCVEAGLVLGIEFENDSFVRVIEQVDGCGGFLVYKSFQFRCLEDSALFMAAVGILLAFNYVNNPSYLNLKLNYTRLSWRFMAKTVVTLVLPVLVLLIFVNPLWDMI